MLGEIATQADASNSAFSASFDHNLCLLSMFFFRRAKSMQNLWAQLNSRMVSISFEFSFTWKFEFFHVNKLHRSSVETIAASVLPAPTYDLHVAASSASRKVSESKSMVNFPTMFCSRDAVRVED